MNTPCMSLWFKCSNRSRERVPFTCFRVSFLLLWILIHNIIDPKNDYPNETTPSAIQVSVDIKVWGKIKNMKVSPQEHVWYTQDTNITHEWYPVPFFKKFHTHPVNATSGICVWTKCSSCERSIRKHKEKAVATRVKVNKLKIIRKETRKRKAKEETSLYTHTDRVCKQGNLQILLHKEKCNNIIWHEIYLFGCLVVSFFFFYIFFSPFFVRVCKRRH